MTVHIVDTNVLLYAINDDSAHHAAARTWLDDALAGGATVGFDWTVLVAFLRLSTMARVFDQPLTPMEAADQARRWLDEPAAEIVTPGPDHLERVATLLTQAATGGNLVNDAHLAALAVGSKGVIVSFDSDFDRFDGVRRHEPGRKP